MSKIVIYARVSTEDKQDFERQITELEKRVHLNHQSSVEVEIVSEKISGYKLNNGSKLEFLLDKIKENPGEYGYLYVWELSRLGRNPLETRNRIDFLLKNGVNIYVETLNTTLGNDGDNLSGALTKMILLLLLEFSHIEAQTTKLRIKSGLRQSASNGKAGGSNHLPYGFKKDVNKNLLICENESIVIKRIFELYNKGAGTKRISTILNIENVPTRYNKLYGSRVINFATKPKEGSSIKWSDKQVHDILKNTIYKGDRRFKNEIFKIPAIIDAKLFDHCNYVLKAKYTKSDVKHTYLLKSLLTCKCGRNFMGVNKPDEKIYKCSSKLQTGGSCGILGINIHLIESSIFHLVLSSSHLVNFMKSSAQVRDEIQNDVDILNLDILNFEKDLKKLKRKQLILLDDLLEEGFSRKILEEKTNFINREILRVEDKLVAKKDEFRSKKSLLSKKFESNYDIIYNSKNNRQYLKQIFGDIINKISVIETAKDYTIIEVNIDILEKNSITFTLKLFNSYIKKKNKKYIYSIESVSIKALHNGSEIDMRFERDQFIELKKSFDKYYTNQIPIHYGAKEIKNEEFIYNSEINNSHVFSSLKYRFLNLFSDFFTQPVELTFDQLICI